MIALTLLITGLLTVILADPCQRLAVCALDKCISNRFQPKSTKTIIRDMLDATNFACVFGPACYDLCSKCNACKYAQKQIRNIVMGSPTEGRCFSLEKCAKTCIEQDTNDPFSCVFRRKCARHCLNQNGCEQCYSVVRRVFTGLCHRHHLADFFGGSQKCRPMFDQLSVDFVMQNQ